MATPSQGFARAFFYAGARALLVSHWCVDNAAIVALITKYSDALKTDPKIGRAEALRRTMAALTAGGVGPHTLSRRLGDEIGRGAVARLPPAMQHVVALLHVAPEMLTKQRVDIRLIVSGKAAIAYSELPSSFRRRP